MRVLIDATYARRAPRSGTAVYIDRITDALGQLTDPPVEVVTVVNERRRPPGSGGAASAGNLLADVRWTERELPRLARRHGADLIHHPLPAIAHATRLPQVVTVHDLAFLRLPEAFAPAWRRWAAVTHRDAARRAGAVIAVSHTTAADVRALWDVPAPRLVVARHGPGQQLPTRPRDAHPGHFLYVGDDEPRKDLSTLLAAHRRYASAVAEPLPLTIVGGAASASQRDRDTADRVAADRDAGDRDATPERLAELLAGAAALVHPSRHEGFALTVLEAMGAGTPVIAARAGGTNETCGAAARYVTAGDVGELATAMTEIAADARLRDRLSRAGIARASAFSWKEAARAHRAAYSLAVTS